MRTLAILAVSTIVFLGSNPVAAQVQLNPNPNSAVKLESMAPPWKAILAAKAGGATKSDKRQFVFECSTKVQKNKLQEAIVNQKKPSQKIIAIEDKPAKVERLSQRPFVTGALECDKTAAGEASYQPILTALDQGNSVEVTIKPLDKQHVQLDASFSFTTIDEPEAVAVGERNTQAVTNNTITQRVVRTVRLGETCELKMQTLGSNKATVIEYSIAEL